MAGFAIDVGVWYQAQRKQQAIADAAALAAAGLAREHQAGDNRRAGVRDQERRLDQLDQLLDQVHGQRHDHRHRQDDRPPTSSRCRDRLGHRSATAVARADNLGSAYGAAPSGSSTPSPNSRAQAAPASACRQHSTTKGRGRARSI